MNAIDDEPTDRALVIGVDVDHNHYPYTVLGCVSKDEQDETLQDSEG